MIKFRRGILIFCAVLVAAAVAIIAAAASTSWWLVLALIPLAMVVACLAMMTAPQRTPGGPSAARCGCCVVSCFPVVGYGSGSKRGERTADAHG